MLPDHHIDEHADLFGTSIAVFSPARTHRYVLLRVWDAALPRIVFLMLNPSTADAFVNDPTVRRCLGFARRNGYGSLVVVNLFALRATNPAELRTHPDPIGEHNNQFIVSYCATGSTVVAAWGVHGTLGDRWIEVTEILASAGVGMKCLGTTKAGQPRHPLYVPGATPLADWLAAA